MSRFKWLRRFLRSILQQFPYFMFKTPLFPDNTTSGFPQRHLEAKVIHLGSMSLFLWVDLSLLTYVHAPLLKINLPGGPNRKLRRKQR